MKIYTKNGDNGETQLLGVLKFQKIILGYNAMDVLMNLMHILVIFTIIT